MLNAHGTRTRQNGFTGKQKHSDSRRVADFTSEGKSGRSAFSLTLFATGSGEPTLFLLSKLARDPVGDLF